MSANVLRPTATSEFRGHGLNAAALLSEGRVITVGPIGTTVLTLDGRVLSFQETPPREQPMALLRVEGTGQLASLVQTREMQHELRLLDTDGAVTARHTVPLESITQISSLPRPAAYLVSGLRDRGQYLHGQVKKPPVYRSYVLDPSGHANEIEADVAAYFAGLGYVWAVGPTVYVGAMDGYRLTPLRHEATRSATPILRLFDIAGRVWWTDEYHAGALAERSSPGNTRPCGGLAGELVSQAEP